MAASFLQNDEPIDVNDLFDTDRHLLQQNNELNDAPPIPADENDMNNEQAAVHAHVQDAVVIDKNVKIGDKADKPMHMHVNLEGIDAAAAAAAAAAHTQERVHVNSNAFLVILVAVFAVQGLVWSWSKHRPKSFFVATLVGLWLFPMLMSVRFAYWRMVFVWAVFSLVFGILLRMARQKPMNPRTPRYLYSWFYVLHKITNILSLVGYMLFLADFLGINLVLFGDHPKEEREFHSKLMHHQHEAHMHALQGDADADAVLMAMEEERQELDALSHNFHHVHFSEIGIYLLFYGLYYGVLARDTAQLCADWISSALGFSNADGFPLRRVPDNICAVCNNALVNHDIGLFEDISDRLNADGTNMDGTASAAAGAAAGRGDKSYNSSTQRRMKLMQQRQRVQDQESAAQNGRQQSRRFPFNLLSMCSFSNTKQDEEIQINCKHRFHGFCIRGWIMIGKRSICPVCKEKVNMKGIFANPWHKQDRAWSQLLDGVRYLLVWNPIIMLTGNLMFNMLGLSMTAKQKSH